MAAALVLDGDLSAARSIFEERAKKSGLDFVDSVIGLVAVLRAQGELHRAKSLIESLSARKPNLWVDCLLVRLRMDSGDLAGAVELVQSNRKIPADLAVAALARAGAWDDALSVYRSRTSRKVRSTRVEADLMAAAAMVSLREGQGKRARKLFAKAGKLSKESLLAAIGNELAEPQGARLLSGEDWPWAVHRKAETFEIVQSSHSVEAADAIRLTDGPEAALGFLKDHLDEQPGDWPARVRYVEWILGRDDPKLWRAELKEIMVLLKNEPRLSIKGYCRVCGYGSREALVVCPRCDAVGLMTSRRPNHVNEPRYLERAQGSGLHALLLDGD